MTGAWQFGQANGAASGTRDTSGRLCAPEYECNLAPDPGRPLKTSSVAPMMGPMEDEAIEVPADALSEAALIGVIDDFILREGTEYGEEDVPLETKRAQILEQLRSNEAVIAFDPETKTCTILLRK